MRNAKENKTMKKLLVLAAVIVAGVVANAASFKWTAANIYASNGTDKFSGTANLYAYLSTADISTAIKVDSATVASGIVKDGSNTGRTFSNDSLAGGNVYNFYFTIEDAGKTFTSDAKVVSAQATLTSNITFGNMQSATQNASNWKGSSPVPEPTSGLLFLLGVAGLVLKRKRA